MILHAITGFEKKGEKKLPNGVKNGYKAYIKKNNLKISKQIDQTQLFAFDMQGEVRSKFEENTLNSSEFLSKYFPKDINSTIYRQLVDAEIDRLFDYLEKKFKLDAEIKKLSIFTIPCIENSSESLIFEKNLRRSKGKTDDFCEIKDAIDVILNNYQKLLSYKIEADERNTLNAHIDALQMIYKKYESVIQRIEHTKTRGQLPPGSLHGLRPQRQASGPTTEDSKASRGTHSKAEREVAQRAGSVLREGVQGNASDNR